MRNYLCIILFFVLSLTIPATSAYAYGGGGGSGGGKGGGGGKSTSSETTNPPSGFKPVKQESADGDSNVLQNISEIEPSSEPDPGKEEEVAELVEDVNLMEETAEEGDVEGDSKDSAEGTTSDEKAPDENTPAEDQGDKKTELATLVDDINPHGSAQESETTRQQDPGQSLIGTQGTLPGTKSATLEYISTEKNEDGSVSTWADYSNDTVVRTTVNLDGTYEVTIMLDSGTIIRPGREYIHTGGSLNPPLDAIIGILDVTAAAGTAAGWVLSVTPAGALANAGIKSAWAVQTGIQAVRAGADVYGQKIKEGASQSEAVLGGLKQTGANAAIVTGIGTVLGNPYKDAIGSVVGQEGKNLTEVAVNTYANFAADRSTENITDYSPGWLPW